METKPAIYTTEFWMTVIGMVAVVLNQLGFWDWASKWHGGIIGAIILAGYNYSRGNAKKGVAADPSLEANYRLVPRSSDGLRRR